MSKFLQDLLLLLDIWFKIGKEESIDKLMNEKIEIISMDSWFMVIPQLLTRINVTNPLIRKTLILLLKKIGLNNPRSLTYPLTVLKNSKSKVRAEAVSLILEDIKKKHEKLFKESELIINELNRSALCLHEQWMESIEESAKLFFQTKDIKTASKILSELHKKMEIPPQSMNEIHFHHLYRSDLKEAYQLLQDYLENDNLISIKDAWNIYQNCYKSMLNEFSNIESMDLKSISPALFQFSESEIEIPGIYQNIGNDTLNPIVKISSFSRNLIVLKSKEKPRKIVINGSDGKEYPYLLKGHEDIRQDERVMQLFGLVNALLSKDSDTRGKNLSIKRYPVIPLSHNTGIIGWVSSCDTLNQLIKEYRIKNNIPVNMEYRLLTKFHHKSDTSTIMTKLEVFKHTMDNTVGSDLNRILWIKSKSAEDWLDRRTNYSRSLAVMSIVGYILGLGDRHPSNIMLDRKKGRVIHIDFGDCFEVAMKRDKFPEKVPFRLTRMLIKALEIGGIEGTFRITCENVMRVMRENKDSLNVILAAFVHDPLTSFRLLIPLIMKNVKNKNKNEEKNNKFGEDKAIKGNKIMNIMINKNKRNGNEIEKKRMGSEERQLYNEFEEKDFIESNDLKQIIKIVLERVSDKLNGTDFNKNEELKISEQVRRLICQATSHENLSQSYIGWRPFW
jgi:FKBP12-rapamycin complex-associated protein